MDNVMYYSNVLGVRECRQSSTMTTVIMSACVLAQAVVTAMQWLQNVSRDEAERLFEAGVQYTEEEQRARQRGGCIVKRDHCVETHVSLSELFTVSTVQQRYTTQRWYILSAAYFVSTTQWDFRRFSSVWHVPVKVLQQCQMSLSTFWPCNLIIHSTVLSKQLQLIHICHVGTGIVCAPAVHGNMQAASMLYWILHTLLHVRGVLWIHCDQQNCQHKIK